MSSEEKMNILKYIFKVYPLPEDEVVKEEMKHSTYGELEDMYMILLEHLRDIEKIVNE